MKDLRLLALLAAPVVSFQLNLATTTPRRLEALCAAVPSVMTLHHPKEESADDAERVGETPTTTTDEKKKHLLEAIAVFQEATARDGAVPVDFGVRGGELESKDRTPRNLLKTGAFRQVSNAVGDAADGVAAAIDTLASTESLAAEATKFLGTRDGESCPLHGGWRSVWSTAADATFSNNSKRGDAVLGNVIDGVSAKITNVITFRRPPHEEEDEKRSPFPRVEQLRVTIRGLAVSQRRVQITFRYATVRFAKRFLFLFKSLVIPVPAVAFTRLLFLFRPNKSAPPPPYFDVLYLDHDLRIQKTGDDNLFVQTRLQDPSQV